MNLNNNGTRDESNLDRRCPNNLEFLDLDAKFAKSGIGEVKTINSINALSWISRNLIMIIVL